MDVTVNGWLVAAFVALVLLGLVLSVEWAARRNRRRRRRRSEREQRRNRERLRRRADSEHAQRQVHLRIVGGARPDALASSAALPRGRAGAGASPRPTRKGAA